jgi:hypothetical protein
MSVESCTDTSFYADIKNIINLIARGMWVLIHYTRGSCVAFTQKRLMENAGCGDPLPVMMTIVKDIMNKLVEQKLLTIDDTRSLKRYMVCKDSQLWNVIKRAEGPEDVFEYLARVVEP